MDKPTGEMGKATTKQDLESHPELSPILDSDKDGNIVCIGWLSPIYDWDDIQLYQNHERG